MARQIIVHDLNDPDEQRQAENALKAQEMSAVIYNFMEWLRMKRKHEPKMHVELVYSEALECFRPFLGE